MSSFFHILSVFLTRNVNQPLAVLVNLFGAIHFFNLRKSRKHFQTVFPSFSFFFYDHSTTKSHSLPDRTATLWLHVLLIIQFNLSCKCLLFCSPETIGLCEIHLAGILCYVSPTQKNYTLYSFSPQFRKILPR